MMITVNRDKNKIKCVNHTLHGYLNIRTPETVSNVGHIPHNGRPMYLLYFLHKTECFIWQASINLLLSHRFIRDMTRARYFNSEYPDDSNNNLCLSDKLVLVSLWTKGVLQVSRCTLFIKHVELLFGYLTVWTCNQEFDNWRFHSLIKYTANQGIRTSMTYARAATLEPIKSINGVRSTRLNWPTRTLPEEEAATGFTATTRTRHSTVRETVGWWGGGVSYEEGE